MLNCKVDKIVQAYGLECSTYAFCAQLSGDDLETCTRVCGPVHLHVLYQIFESAT